MPAQAVEGFTFHFGEYVRVLSPHPEAGCEGQVMNAWLFRDGRENVSVSVPGGSGSYDASELEPVRKSAIPNTPASPSSKP